MEDVIYVLRIGSICWFLLFGALYWVMTGGKWRQRPEGIWLMALVALIIQSVALGAAIAVFGMNFWGRSWFQAIVLLEYNLWPLSLIILLIRAQRLASRARQYARRDAEPADD